MALPPSKRGWRRGGSQANREKWEKRLGELRQYKLQHGHTSVPKRYPQVPGLGEWVMNQRKQCRYMEEGKPSSMTGERRAALEDLGFVRRVEKASWEKRLEELQQYKKQHGDANVPYTHKPNHQLAVWVKTQRMQYRYMQEGKPTFMTEDKIAALNEVGFVWRVKTRTQTVPWDDRLKELLQYKAHHGDANVPQRFQANLPLARWAMNQRQEYRKMQQGKPTNMTAERVKKLEKSGFAWSALKERRRGGSNASTRFGASENGDEKNHNQNVEATVEDTPDDSGVEHRGDGEPESEPSKKKKKKKKAEGTESGVATIVTDGGVVALPDPGNVSKDFQFYSTLENETVSQIAEKFGVSSWRDIVDLPENKRYGKLCASTKFKLGTIMRAPKSHSKWKIKSLLDEKRTADEEMAKCACCSGLERAIDATSNPMLMCDGCDLTCHLKCADGNLTSVPAGDWFCQGCIDILGARTEGHYPELLATAAKGKSKSSTARNLVGHPGPTLRATLPPLPDLPPKDSLDVDGSHRRRLNQALRSRRGQVSRSVAESHNANRSALAERMPRLEAAAQRARTESVAKIAREEAERERALRRHGLVEFGGENKSEYARNTWIQAKTLSGATVKFYERDEVQLRRRGGFWGGTIIGTNVSENWRILSERRSNVVFDPIYSRYKGEARRGREKLERCQAEFREAQRELKNSTDVETMERAKFDAEYKALLGEGDDVGTNMGRDLDREEFVPKLMGRITVVDESHVHAMNMLLEPDELVLFLPYNENQHRGSIGGSAGASVLNNLTIGSTYAVFARAALFDRKRDDVTPLERGGVRDAQRVLMDLLRTDESHRHAVVSEAKLPHSVRVRGDDGETMTTTVARAGGVGSGISLFDLSELVRDCNSDLDLPKEPTPPRMKDNGLELRGYQQSSLRWLLDKESNTTGLGTAGEFWDRYRFLGDFSREDYFFCNLTGTFCLDIFDYRTDTGQKDAALDCGGFSTGGILGEEMGLGKTIIMLALIVANPPPKKNQMLKREHLWSLERHTVQHPEYVAPPSVLGAVSSASKNVCLSNGTLVIVPMTLISQWQSEIERYAPWLSVMTLHNSENPSMELIATTDVVVMSASLLLAASLGPQKKGSAATNVNTSRQLFSIVKRIHWHRIVVDEAHYQNVGQKTKLVLASLSSTHRHCVTGTPLGNSLDDLQGQLRFLRLPQLQRLEFWQNNVGDPYYDHSNEALRVLRSILSRLVVRHSKAQTDGGQSIVSLPPRTVETELIPFGSEAEQRLYSAIDKRSRYNFERLRQQSTASVLEKSNALAFQLLCARQAAAHASMIDVARMDAMNRATDPAYKEKIEAAEQEAERGGKKDRAAILATAEHRAKGSAKTRVRNLVLKLQGTNELVECPVCLEPVGEVDVAVTTCGHPFCKECILNVLDAGTSRRDPSGDCPQCRKMVFRTELTFLGEATDAGERGTLAEEDGGKETAGTVVTDANGFRITATEVNVAVSGSSVFRVGFKNAKKESAKAIRERRREDAAAFPTINPDFFENFDMCEGKIGTKVARLLQEIDFMHKNDPTAKAVVFSQFVDLLDICGQELAVRGIRFVRVYGSDKAHERADALLDFSSDPGIKIFLLSMRAGAVGLNLTAANHCFILDPPQNTALEEQAIDRVHRIGQSRPVTVKRFIVKGSVEERIVHVRRSLSNDRPASGTDVCDASLMTSSPKPKKRGRTANADVQGEAKGNDFHQERLQNLATLFGTTMVPTVFKA